MKKIFFILLLLILSTTIANADIIDTQSNNTTFKPATYLDTEASFDIPDEWIYEGVIFDENYSQKKYTYIKNLDVSIMYGMRDLKEEIRKKMPFVSPDSLINSLSEESLVDIIGSASKSTVEEKWYGNNKFYEFSKEQEADDRGKKVIVYCIVDMMVKEGNIYSFSYVYRDKKDGILDYGNVLKSFKLKGQEEVVVEPTPQPVDVVDTPTPEPINNEPKEETTPTPIEIVETPKPDEPLDITSPIENNDLKESSGEVIEVISGDLENITTITETSGDEIIEPTTQSGELTEEEQFEQMSKTTKVYEQKGFIHTILSVISRNPVLCILLVVFVILDIIVIIIKKKRNKKNKDNNNK